jgi:hypothetical protein
LPEDAPDAVRAFLAGDADALVVEDGPLAWLPVPGVVRRIAGPRAAPRLFVRPGSVGGAEVTVGWGPVGLTVRVTVAAGRLAVAFPGIGNPLLRGLHGGVRSWVDRANAHLDEQGRNLHPLEVHPGRAVLRAGPP